MQQRARVLAMRYGLAVAVLAAISIVRVVLMLAAPPRQIDASQVLFRVSVDAALWLVLALPLLWLAEHAPISRRWWFLTVPLHIGMAVAFMLLHTTVALQFARWVVAPINMRFAVALYGQSQVNFLTYWALLLAAHAFAHQLRYRERERRAAQLEVQQAQLEAELARAQLQALQTQLQPHFLFNALNSVSAFIHSDPDRAERMLTGLGDLLRGVLESSRTSAHPLRNELAFTERYLAIQEERFGDRLEVRKLIDSESLNALVPTLVLQPIVENAVQHGVAARLSGGRVDIEAARAGDVLHITVRDISPGPVAPAGSGSGVGLSNTRARLAQMYGDQHHLETQATADGFVVHVRIPWRTQV